VCGGDRDLQEHSFVCQGACYNPTWMDETKEGEAFVIDDFFNYWVEYCHVGTCSTTLRKSAVVEAVPWASG